MAAKSRRGGLGKGLGALIPTQAEERPRLGDAAADVIIGKVPGEATENAAASSTPLQGEIETVSPADFGARLHDLPVAEIAPNPQQPRTYFAEEELAELAHSIKEIGLLQPIVVRHAPAGSERPYELIMGERRLRASEQAGLETITAIVRETEDEFLLRDALLENIHRVQLNPLEEAAAYQQLLEEFSVTQAELARKIGRSRPVIANCIRLLNLPVDVQQSVAAGVLSAGHARALLGLEGGESVQIALAQRIVAEGLSVRTTEEAVTLLNAGGTAGQVERATRTTRQQPAIFDSFATSLSDALDTRVLVSMGKRKGKIVVEFSDVADFERIMDQLGRTPGN